MSAENSKPQKNRQKKIPKRITADYLHNSGLYYLERYAASSGHFRTVMTRKVKRSCHYHTDQNYDECIKLIDNLIEKFLRAGLLNDDLYLRSMITSYRRKGLSSSMIKQKLFAKSIAADSIEDAIKQFDAEQDLAPQQAEIKAAAIFCRRKKLGAYRIKDIENEKELAKMARAGFSFDISKKILGMSDHEIEEIIMNY